MTESLQQANRGVLLHSDRTACVKAEIKKYSIIIELFKMRVVGNNTEKIAVLDNEDFCIQC